MQASSEALKAKCLLAFFSLKHCATLLQWDNIYYQPPTDSYVNMSVMAYFVESSFYTLGNIYK